MPNLTLLRYDHRQVGLCGRTGSGKSSLVLSLLRMVRASRGRVLLDGTDVQDVPLEVLRSSISFIPQDTQLFRGSVRSGQVEGECEYQNNKLSYIFPKN